jgi:hypothetical protein
MVQPGMDPMIERFELLLIEIQHGVGTLRVPLVDKWLEIQLAMVRVPEAEERVSFFKALGALVAELRVAAPELRWYFLHKPPGLKLRFHNSAADPATVGAIVEKVSYWNFSWAPAVAIGSVFDQAELMASPYRRDVEALLTLAADCHLEAAIAGHRCAETAWADFLTALLEAIGLDRWLAYEALARLRRLRAVELSPAAAGTALLDPAPMLAHSLPQFASGFEASVSLLQGLNLLLNIWGIDGATQLAILDAACAATRPALLSVR